MRAGNSGGKKTVLKVMGQPIVFHFILFGDFLFFGLFLGGIFLYNTFSAGTSNFFSIFPRFLVGLGSLSLAFHSLWLLLGKTKSPKYLIRSIFASTGLLLIVIYSIKIYAAIRADNISFIFDSTGSLELVLFVWTAWNFIYFNQTAVEDFIKERHARASGNL